MKKFNSFFAIAAVALSAVFGLSSCEKNDEVFEQPEVVEMAPVEMADSYLLVAATAEQMQYMDATFTVSVVGVTKQVKMSDMTEVKDAMRDVYLAKVKETVDTFKEGEGKEDIRFFEFNLGQVSGVRVISANYYATAHPDHEINVFGGCTIANDRQWVNPKSDIRYFQGIYDLEGFVQLL